MSLPPLVVQIIQINLVLKNAQCQQNHTYNSSNNTNKLSPQELVSVDDDDNIVQIIQINLVLKNDFRYIPIFALFK